MNEKKKHGTSVKARRVISYIVLVLLTFLCLIWFYILVINSTRSHSQISGGFSPLPGASLLKNWDSLMKGTLPVWRGLLNSFIVSVASAVLCTYFSTMTAYAIHTYNFKAKKFMYTFILAVMMIPTQVTALGFVQLIGKMKLMDSLLPLFLPSIASPVTFFYMKQYMDSVLSLSLVEAARIDGAGEFKTFNIIVLPLMKPAIAVQAIFSFVTSWNNYFMPSLLIHKDTKKTLPILIAQLRSADWLKFDMGQVYIMILFSILPVVIVYLILSKYIVGGVTAGGVKE